MVLDNGTQEYQRMNRTHIQASTQDRTDSCQMLALGSVRWAPGPCLPILPLKSRKLAVTIVIIGGEMAGLVFPYPLESRREHVAGHMEDAHPCLGQC